MAPQDPGKPDPVTPPNGRREQEDNGKKHSASPTGPHDEQSGRSAHGSSKRRASDARLRQPNCDTIPPPPMDWRQFSNVNMMPLGKTRNLAGIQRSMSMSSRQDNGRVDEENLNVPKSGQYPKLPVQQHYPGGRQRPTNAPRQEAHSRSVSYGYRPRDFLPLDLRRPERRIQDNPEYMSWAEAESLKHKTEKTREGEQADRDAAAKETAERAREARRSGIPYHSTPISAQQATRGTGSRHSLGSDSLDGAGDLQELSGINVADESDFDAPESSDEEEDDSDNSKGQKVREKFNVKSRGFQSLEFLVKRIPEVEEAIRGLEHEINSMRDNMQEFQSKKTELSTLQKELVLRKQQRLHQDFSLGGNVVPGTDGHGDLYDPDMALDEARRRQSPVLRGQFTSTKNSWMKPQIMRHVPVDPKTEDDSDWWDPEWVSFRSQEFDIDHAKRLLQRAHEAKDGLPPGADSDTRKRVELDYKRAISAVTQIKVIRSLFAEGLTIHPNQLISKESMPPGGLCKRYLLYSISLSLRRLCALRDHVGGDGLRMSPVDFFRWRLHAARRNTLGSTRTMRTLIHELSCPDVVSGRPSSSDRIFREAIHLGAKHLDQLFHFQRRRKKSQTKQQEQNKNDEAEEKEEDEESEESEESESQEDEEEREEY